jgi:hypothetical protein
VLFGAEEIGHAAQEGTVFRLRRGLLVLWLDLVVMVERGFAFPSVSPSFFVGH